MTKKTKSFLFYGALAYGAFMLFKPNTAAAAAATTGGGGGAAATGGGQPLNWEGVAAGAIHETGDILKHILNQASESQASEAGSARLDGMLGSVGAYNGLEGTLYGMGAW